MTASTGKRVQVQKPVQNWFMAHPGTIIHYAALAQELSIPEHSTATACSNLAKAGLLEKAARRGEYFLSRTKRQPVNELLMPIGTMFEVLGLSFEGKTLLRSTEGVIMVLGKL